MLENAETYTKQAFKILDRDKTEIVYNGDWFRKMTYEEVLKLNSRVTMQQMLAREDFKARVEGGKEVRLHEIQYPIMQGWDSVEIRADVELGGTDQLFNILVGRDLQKEEGMLPQIAMTMPLLEGLDGVRKMSKSYGNYVGVDEAPEMMFGKMMSASDELMDRYYLVLLGEKRDMGLHPMEAKKLLAWKSRHAIMIPPLRIPRVLTGKPVFQEGFGCRGFAGSGDCLPACRHECPGPGFLPV